MKYIVNMFFFQRMNLTSMMIPLMRISFHPPQTRTVGRMSFHLSCQRRARKTTIKKKRKNGPNSFNKQSQYKHQCPFRDKRQCWRTHRQPIWTSIRGCDVLRECSLKCGAKHPELLRSPKLKKHIATLSQILNLKDNELDILANFLGHDIRTHREYYRLPEESLQVAKMSKLLFTLESNFNPRQWHRRDFIFW